MKIFDVYQVGISKRVPLWCRPTQHIRPASQPSSPHPQLPCRNVPLVEALLECARVDVNAAALGGVTPLHAACWGQPSFSHLSLKKRGLVGRAAPPSSASSFRVRAVRRASAWVSLGKGGDDSEGGGMTDDRGCPVVSVHSGGRKNRERGLSVR